MENFGSGTGLFFVDAFEEQERQEEAADAPYGVGPPGYQRRILRVRMRHVVGDVWYRYYTYAQAAADFVFCGLIILKDLYKIYYSMYEVRKD